MSDQPKFADGNYNPFEDLRSTVNAASNNTSGPTLQGHFGMSKRHVKNAMALMDKHHANVMDHLKANYGYESQFQTHLSGLREQEASGAHGRNLEMVGAIQKASEGGTDIAHKFAGGGEVSYTRKQRKPRQVKPAGTPSFPPVKTHEEPQQELPAAPAAETPVKKQKFAQRDPKTGKISGYADTPQKPVTKKKAAPRKRK